MIEELNQFERPRDRDGGVPANPFGLGQPTAQLARARHDAARFDLALPRTERFTRTRRGGPALW
jgi:hypothetical protein